MIRTLGIRNTTCSKENWCYLVFYDIDKPELTLSEIEKINEIAKRHRLSFILYKTKHGYHFIGLTPKTAYQWANAFSVLHAMFHSYYSGQTIRLSRKHEEKQELIKLELHFGKVIPNLYNLYCSRFNLEKMPWQKDTAEYLLIFEKYRTLKE